MKILWLHSHFLYSLGATKYVFEVCKILNKKYELEVVVENSSEYWKQRFASEGIKFTLTTGRSSNEAVYWLLLPFFLIRELLKIRSLSKGNEIIITSIFPMNFISIFLGKTTIFLCFEPFSFFYNRELINKLSPVKKLFTSFLSKIYSPLDKIGIKYTRIIFTLNQDRADLIKKIYGREVDHLSGMAVEGNFFKQVRNRALIEKYKGNIIILHSTDFTIPKGTHYLIRAMPLIIKRIPNIRLLIMSTVQDLKEKEQLVKLIDKTNINKYVEFLGFVDEKMLPGYYSLANVTAFVADPENTVSKASLIILESLACETPVVSSVKQLTGMVENKTGYVVDPRNSADLSEKLCRILSDTNLQKKMGKFGCRLVLKNYGWKNVANVFEKQISELNSSNNFS